MKIQDFSFIRTYWDAVPFLFFQMQLAFMSQINTCLQIDIFTILLSTLILKSLFDPIIGLFDRSE